MSDPHRWSVRVYWEDTDASGVVYHANYLRWFERARTEWLRSRGGDQQAWMETADLAFTVTELNIRYRRPARLDDELRIETVVIQTRRASLRFAQRLLRMDRDEVLAEAEVRAACVSRQTFRPRGLPDVLI